MLLLLQTTPSFGGIPQLSSSDASWIDTINFYRTASGLNPITEDKQLSVAVGKHITYLTMSDPKYFTGPYVSRHRENPASPFYSREGSRSGQELTTTLTNEQSHAVDLWMAAPFHAIGFMREGLRKIGWASAFNSRSGFYDSGADVLNGLTFRRTKIITFPGNGSFSRMDNFQGESPDPREACGTNYRSFTGLPLWVSLTSRPTHQMSAQILTPSGAVLTSGRELCIVNEYNMKSSDAIYGPAGKAIIRADHMVLIIPRVPLTPGVQEVSLQLRGRPKIAWSFTVIPAPATISLDSRSSATEISWSSPPALAGNPTVGYEIVVGDANLRNFRTFRTVGTTFPISRIGGGNHWLCVRAVAKYRSGECPKFVPLTASPELASG